MAASSTNADFNLNSGDERKGENNVEGKLPYPLYCDRTSNFSIKGNLLSSERCLFCSKLHIIVDYNDQSSLSMVQAQYRAPIKAKDAKAF